MILFFIQDQPYVKAKSFKVAMILTFKYRELQLLDTSYFSLSSKEISFS